MGPTSVHVIPYGFSSGKDVDVNRLPLNLGLVAMEVWWTLQTTGRRAARPVRALVA